MSENETAAAVPQTTAAAPLPDLSPPAAGGGGLLAIAERLANLPNPPIEVIERLLAQRRIEEDRAAERAFNASLSLAKGEVEPILKKHEVDFQSEKTGKRTKYKFEEFADIARVIDPVFGKHGLAYRFSIAQDGAKVSVTLILSHADGYSERMPPLTATVDAGGTSMNPLQALGSALTYLQRYSLRAGIGLASGRDDDARSLSIGGEKIDVQQMNELQAIIDETGSSPVMLMKLMGVEEMAAMTVEQWKRAKDVLGVRLAEKKAARKHASARNDDAPTGK
jgi:hypothetical protein